MPRNNAANIADAVAIVMPVPAESPAPTPAPTPEVRRDAAWREREQIRQRDGSRKLPPWAEAAWWNDAIIGSRGISRTQHRLCDHHAHVAKSNPRLLAYTASADKGERDIQTMVKPGKYLTRFFSDCLSPNEINDLAAWFVRGHKEGGYFDPDAYPLHFATTADEIERVYQQGPYSCMRDNPNGDRGPHPVRAYAAGDLAIAYFMEPGACLKDGGRVMARALVWPDRKAAGRLYPTPNYAYRDTDHYLTTSEAADAMNALGERLRGLGYDLRGDFTGANLAKIPHSSGRNRWLMPYLDHGYGVRRAGDDCWTMADCDGDDSGDVIRCSSTCGWIVAHGEGEVQCHNCDDWVDEDDTWAVWSRISPDGLEGRGFEHCYCQDCTENNAYYCDVVAAWTLVETVELPDGRDVNVVYARNLGWWRSDFRGRWFGPDEMPCSFRHYDNISRAERDAMGFRCPVTGTEVLFGWQTEDHHLSRPLEGLRFAPIASDNDVQAFLAQHDETVEWLEANWDLFSANDAREEALA